VAEDIEVRLAGLPKFGAGIGLHRMMDFAATLPAPWFTGLDAIKVAGSKGKGSTSAIVAEILQRLGIRTGLYTSPHLWRFHERIRIDGDPIADQDLARHGSAALRWKDEYERRHPGDRVGAFEVFTATALAHFAASGVEAVVSEAGIGGRYDSTRVIPGRIVALTSVELEHTDLLGDTLELIAYDKADLCPDGGVLVSGRLDQDLSRRLPAYSALRSIEFVEAARPGTITRVTYDSNGMRFDLDCPGAQLRDLRLALPGDHQAGNAAVAIAAAARWVEQNRPGTARDRFEQAVRAALGAVRWPGRLERISRDPEILVDVGHTPESLRAVAATVERIVAGRPILLVTGVSVDKDVEAILRAILPVATEVICTRAWHKGCDVARIASLCESIRSGIVRQSAERIEDAVDLALGRANQTGAVILIAGGLFLAIEAWTHLQGKSPRDLRFF
jgi:dihydrofolate synthase/folylpolyglutamate synthase